jgi:hypothetical protein
MKHINKQTAKARSPTESICQVSGSVCSWSTIASGVISALSISDYTLVQVVQFSLLDSLLRKEAKIGGRSKGLFLYV